MTDLATIEADIEQVLQTAESFAPIVESIFPVVTPYAAVLPVAGEIVNLVQKFQAGAGTSFESAATTVGAALQQIGTLLTGAPAQPVTTALPAATVDGNPAA